VVNLKNLILAVCLVTVAVVAALRFWPSDERAIRKQIERIETLGSKASDEKPVNSLLHARQLAELFSDPCTLQVESANFQGQYPRKQIQDRIVMLRGSYSQATVSIHDLHITIAEKERATIRCTLRVKGEGKSQPVADVQELSAEMRKVEGDWLLASVTLVEVLER
jgi:hypothetical protein